MCLDDKIVRLGEERGRDRKYFAQCSSLLKKFSILQEAGPVYDPILLLTISLVFVAH
jgi:hypothetical protein